MKNFFPSQNKGYTYLQTNRSNVLGSLWSTFNLDFQTNLGVLRLAPKLVINTSSADDADLGRPGAFEYFADKWWAICGTRIFLNSNAELTSTFTEDSAKYVYGDDTSQFDITNPSGTTFRYTYDGTGTDPGITALTFPIGASVTIAAPGFNAANNGTFTVTGSGANFFEVTNASGVVEANVTLDFIQGLSVSGGSAGQDYSPNFSDLENFDRRLWATAAEALYVTIGSAGPWTKIDTLNNNVVHQMVYFKKFDRLYYVRTIISIASVDEDDDVATSGDYFINLGITSGSITSLAASSQAIWIGTQKVSDGVHNVDGVVGSIYQWDGISAQVIQEYPINAAGVIALTVYNDVPYAIDTEGRILKYTGYSFEEIARLPVNRILLTNATKSFSTNGKFVHFNGFTSTKNNTLLVLINNLNEDATDSINENLPSGIWELDLATGNFTHRTSATLAKFSSSTITDFGQNRVLGVGALKMNTLEDDSDLGRGTLLAGISYYTNASSSASAIFIDSPADPLVDNEGQKKGYFVTTWFESQEIADNWDAWWTSYRKFLNENDTITFKYRNTEEDPVEAAITWVNTTSFTVLNSAVDIDNYWTSGTGGEVEILQGTGSGSCAHIINVVNVAGTWTVTIDETITGVTTGTAKARFQKWIKVFSKDPVTPPNNWAVFAVEPDGSQPRIQIKGCFTLTGDGEFYKAILTSNEDITTK